MPIEIDPPGGAVVRLADHRTAADQWAEGDNPDAWRAGWSAAQDALAPEIDLAYTRGLARRSVKPTPYPVFLLAAFALGVLLALASRVIA